MQPVTVVGTFGSTVLETIQRPHLIQDNGFQRFEIARSYLFMLSRVFEEKQYYNDFKSKTKKQVKL